MSSIWVYKLDGTVQCEAEPSEITLEEMRQQLAALIGEKNILSMKKGQRPMIRLCGTPTGRINCYQITDEGWHILQHGTMGPCGFERIDPSPQGEFNPMLVQDLVGHSLRVYKTGEPTTDDFRPSRCNIELDTSKTIVKIWFG